MQLLLFRANQMQRSESHRSDTMFMSLNKGIQACGRKRTLREVRRGSSFVNLILHSTFFVSYSVNIAMKNSSVLYTAVDHNLSTFSYLCDL